MDTELHQAHSAFRAALDALREQVAVIDADGVIVAVNAAWNRFASENGIAESHDWRGTNYLAVCDASRGEYAAEAPEAARGIREVLVGTRAGFEMEYPCHAPNAERWFQLRALRLGIVGRSLVYVAHVDVTARVLAERAMRASEAHYRRLVETAHEGICTVDAAGAITYANHRLAEMLGHEMVDLTGHPIFAFMDPEVAPAARARFTRRDHRVSEVAELPFRRRDGTTMWTRKSASPLVDAEGAFVGAIYLLTDITERRHAEEALRENERRYRLLFERNPMPMYLADEETRRFLAVNDAAIAQYGYSHDEFLGMRIDDIRPLEGRAAFAAVFYATPAGGTFRHQRKDGSLLDVEVTADSVVVGDRAARLVAANDVTERVLAEAQLREVRRQTELLLASAGDGIYALDLGGRTTFVNPVAARLFGAESEDLVGGDLHTLLHGSHADGSGYDIAACPIHHALHDGAVYRSDTDVFWRRDGTSFPVEYVCTPLHEDGRIVGVVVAFRDITQRKQLELQLRQAQKMEAVGRLAGGVAHDFNNLLTVITGYTAILLAELPAEDPVRTDLVEIQAASDRAAALTRQLLAFSRQQVLAPRVIDLQEILAGTANMLGRLVGEDIELTIGGTGAPAYVLADPGQIEQVVMNLVINARDAMPAGGRLSIEVDTAVVNDAVVDNQSDRCAQLTPGDYVCLRVLDTGCGMDEATQARIFDPFFTTKEVGQGTGLGLATVYGIVKQSGGHIVVDSAPGAGTTFCIFLPSVAEAAPDHAVAPADAPALMRSRSTLLIAEDEDALRTIAERVLRKRGYTVLSARDGVEALEVAARYDGPIHLLITDVVMPRMSGQELAERLTQRYGDMPVLFMTGYSADAVASHGMLRPGARLLPKPFAPYDLARAASELLHARRDVVARDTDDHRAAAAAEAA